GGRIFFLAAQESDNFRKRVHRGSLASCNQFWRLCEIIPGKVRDIRLNDHIRLLAPSNIGVFLNDVERAADNVNSGAWIFDAAGFEIYGDDDVRTLDERTFDRYGSGEKAVDQRAAVMVDGYEKSRIVV